ncbi:hypothetical protein ATO11_06755 [Pseudaestuariivita atlantica]|uniref:2-methylcitrate dehydratase n=2 Tax=Pseudaestuariivita atlantica TaxID=1317121 RepID=A0A0L1JRR2_9RHOB|nr:hypothetical protein ATO11_06755 [Pseudaestuariivita atlantica]
MDAFAFTRALQWSGLPLAVQRRARMSLLDLLGVAVQGHATRLSAIIRDYAVAQHPGPLPLPFDGRGVSASGYALALGMTIDAVDGHDGHNPAKGHIGCPLLPALLALAPPSTTGEEFLTTLVAGYEVGARVSVAQHATTPDYHTSGSWGATTGAIAGARLAGLSPDQTQHAAGIAEYHGPRSQMMRCIDHPTMLKDGSGWGAMCATSAILLAQAGFTGAPAITVTDTPDHWTTLGTEWEILRQYFKPWPVCRWAQGPIAGVLALRAAHGLTAADVDHIEVETFHESIRLATARPRTTEEAQYSTSFPVAVAMVHGDVKPADIADTALDDPEILRLSESLKMRESDHANAAFPMQRFARVTLHLRAGGTLTTDWLEPPWSPDTQPSDAELLTKFRAYAGPRADRIEEAVMALDRQPLSTLTAALA